MPTTQGTAHIYGIDAGPGALANATVISFNRTKTPGVNDQTLNELGQRIEKRYDDVATEAQVVVRIRSGFSEAVIGALLAYDGENWIIESVVRAEEQQGYTIVTYNVARYANIAV